MSILNLHFILNNLESFFSLHKGDVLNTNMMTHSTFSFFKTFFTGDSGVGDVLKTNMIGEAKSVDDIA